MQTLSETPKISKHQHDTKTHQKTKKNDWSQKPWDAPLDLVGFPLDVFPLLLRKFSRDLDEGVSNSGSDLSREVLEFYRFDMFAVYIFLLHHVDSSGRIYIVEGHDCRIIYSFS